MHGQTPGNGPLGSSPSNPQPARRAYSTASRDGWLCNPDTRPSVRQRTYAQTEIPVMVSRAHIVSIRRAMNMSSPRRPHQTHDVGLFHGAFSPSWKSSLLSDFVDSGVVDLDFGRLRSGISYETPLHQTNNGAGCDAAVSSGPHGEDLVAHAVEGTLATRA